ncbi:CLUMA_CG003258, isoform A [Clunio marinus]|uniref:Phospholipase A2 n=1 Tax=Clunio marinus TaxID=568069 RepID=A0A1J1HT35_9DIPT|nr:CLUMA_CG003258, isoform A [Clunio marinus]
MKKAACLLSYIIIYFCSLSKANENFKQFDEIAWFDNSGREKYSQYSDLIEASIVSQKYNNNLDDVEFKKSLKWPAIRRSNRLKYGGPKVVDAFFNTLRSVIQPSEKSTQYNETTNGIDTNVNVQNIDFIPTFGNNQDLQFIYMGTKWCGAGDIAQSKRDIGYFYMTDSCCRDHDLCPQMIEAQKSNYGLRNPGKFTRSHCDCDNAFYRCLKSVNTVVSNQIGVIYFNVLGPQCFKKEHPSKCKRRSKRRCVEYEANESESKQYQWFDNKWY